MRQMVRISLPACTRVSAGIWGLGECLSKSRWSIPFHCWFSSRSSCRHTWGPKSTIRCGKFTTNTLGIYLWFVFIYFLISSIGTCQFGRNSRLGLSGSFWNAGNVDRKYIGKEWLTYISFLINLLISRFKDSSHKYLQRTSACQAAATFC